MEDKKNSGFILVSVMLSAALLITAATAFAFFASVQAKRAGARENITKFRSAAQIVVKEVAKMIVDDKNGYDSPAENLYKFPIKLHFSDYKAEVRITPLNNKLPIAGLFLPDGITVRNEYKTAWKNIWSALEHPELAAIVCDFLDRDKKQSLGGSEREGNINRNICDLSELKAIKEIDDVILYGKNNKDKKYGLADFVTVIGDEKININTVLPEVLSLLDNDISLSVAQSLHARCANTPITNTKDLKRIPGFPIDAVTRLNNIISYESTHFQLKIIIKNNSGLIRNYRVILKRTVNPAGIIEWQG